MDQAHLLDRKRRAAGSHHIGKAELLHSDHVDVALDEDALVLARNLALGEPDAKQGFALGIDFRFGRVDVLGGIVALERTSGECNHAPCERMDREHNPLAETVGERAVFVLYGQAGGDEVFGLIARLDRSVGEGRTAGGCPAESPFGDGLVFDAAGAVVRERDALALGGGELLVEELVGEFAHKQQALAPLAVCDLLCRQLFFLDLDVILLG